MARLKPVLSTYDWVACHPDGLLMTVPSLRWRPRPNFWRGIQGGTPPLLFYPDRQSLALGSGDGVVVLARPRLGFQPLVLPAEGAVVLTTLLSR